ncbi:hypothetical protein MUK70_21885 [Dyadobacter chenwenxiniae]|uniref:Outer membrane protein beta-barrel domain-containing protein n=1 Tax=Dyadobacter chenwenxiniae TaxID=2906456 RepID=A0A9X1PK61_9BACT|nr:hypothetical protein [Dyadobacter chenwenxiniae]MCF0061895.1 hypothetical protein [Dyadobacter chenwenxiniae]UON81710.1 hypothetical protein MUK70_21885 [Dyadobacter chenwenxiniae]
MTELPDDELDKLFRKSSEELDPQFDPEDWNTLKKRLDVHDGKVAGGWFKKWWPLGLMALLIPIGFAIYFFTKNPVSKSAEIEHNASAAGELQAQEPAASPVSSKEDASAQPKESAASPVSSKENASAQSKEPAAPPVSSIEPNNTLRNKESRISKSSSKSNIADYQRRKKLPRSQSKTGGVYLEPNRSKGEGGDGAFSINNIAERKSAEPVSRTNAINETGTEREISEDQARLLISAATLASRTLNWENQPEIPMVTFTAPAAMEPSEPEKVEEDYAKWAVRLGYSPDLSTVGFKNYTKPGTAFSLLLEYALSPRFYLQSGVIWSQKDYYAHAKDYELPEYVTKYNTPYGVDGECTMIEIPLGFRYNLIHQAHSKLFLGTGVSSYYAQKEKYKYHYAKYVKYQKDNWQGKSGWFLLSHINASVGYERTITKKLSLVAEPYIRIPIKGVGYGKVNLMTVGTWISLRYTPAF